MTMQRRRSDLSGRAKLRSPGRPPVGRRSERQQFWAAIAAGRSSEQAAATAGVSGVVGIRWFREGGGMPPSHLAPSAPPLLGRYLSFMEREQIALLRANGHGVRQIARQLTRAPSTISRELRRNAATRSGGFEYRATTAQWHADGAARRPKPAKLASNVARLPGAPKVGMPRRPGRESRLSLRRARRGDESLLRLPRPRSFGRAQEREPRAPACLS